MKYVTNDGRVFSAENAADLVEQLRCSAFVPSVTIKEFMREVAERVRLADHTATVDTSSVEAFVDDLLLAGMLEELS